MGPLAPCPYKLRILTKVYLRRAVALHDLGCLKFATFSFTGEVLLITYLLACRHHGSVLQY